jgi:hypothetical protein
VPTVLDEIDFRFNSALAIQLDGGTCVARDITMDATVQDGIDVAAAALLTLERADLRPAGTALSVSGNAEVVNTLIAGSAGGVDVFAGGVLSLSHSTLADITGVALTDANSPSTMTVAHTLFAGNGTEMVGEECDNVYASLSCDCAPMLENVCGAPIFVGGGDYHLVSGSLGLDYGPEDPSLFTGMPCTDLDRAPRLRDEDGDGLAYVDIGAYELGGTSTGVTGLVFDGPTTLSWSDAGVSTYRLYLGDVSTLGYADYGSCLDSTMATTYDHAAEPAADQTWFYLVTAGDGVDEGTLSEGTCAERSLFMACQP